MNPAERAGRLRAVLLDAARRYYGHDDPPITDAEYDRLFAELVQLEAQHPELRTPDSPTQRVGAAALEVFAPAPHAVPMLSLDNAHNEGDFRAFAQRADAAGSLPWCTEPKLDGVSVSLTYTDGLLTRAATRGDGECGEDITVNARTIRSLPLRLDSAQRAVPRSLEVRGEVFVHTSEFTAFNERRTEAEGRFMNPRNFASGSLRQLDSAVSAARPLRIALYTLVDARQHGLNTQSEVLDALEQWGLPVARAWCRHCADVEAVVARFAELGRDRDTLPFEIDGMVVKLDDLDAQAALGFRARTPRWAIAWKFPPREESTTLLAVSFSVGRTGVVTPVACLEAVEIGGVTVTSATLHNQDEIERLGIRIGDRVVVQRAGDVIPKIVKVLQHAEAAPVSMPTHCPSCGTELVQDEEEVALRCPAPQCPAQVKGLLRHFASVDALDIRGLGDKLVDQLVDGGLVREPADLFRLDAATLAGLDRMGERSAKKLCAALDAARTPPLERFLFALGIRHVGAVIAARLAQSFGSIEAVLNADQAALEAVPEVGDIVAASIRDWLQEHPQRVQDLLAAGVKPQAARAQGREGVLSGFTAVVTGTLPTLDRSAAEDLLRSHGAQVTGSVSSRTTFLLAGEKAGSKLAKARSLKVPVIDEAQLQQWLAGGDSPLPRAQP